jgi:predicted lipoprotein
MIACRKTNRDRTPAAAALLLATAFAVPGCKDDGGAGPAADELDLAPALQAFSFQVVVPTYEDLAAKAEALYSACAAFDASPTDASLLNAAAAAWVAAREPWEASEAFLFGPAAFLSLDPSLDSWPVDTQQLDQVLSSGFDLTPEFIREGLGPALRGFHTVEYLLFRDQAPRPPVEVTAREREYLVSCVRVLAADAATLRDEWTNGFAGEVASAGTSGSRYRAPQDALLEMIEGMAAICDEVANGKIADPYDEQNPQLVESRFSGNSLVDFQNNLRSVQNAYRGERPSGPAGAGLDELVRARDPSLDARIAGEIQAAIEAIDAIPEPFEHHLDQASPIEAAQQAIVRVMLSLEQDVKPRLLS